MRVAGLALALSAGGMLASALGGVPAAPFVAAGGAVAAALLVAAVREARALGGPVRVTRTTPGTVGQNVPFTIEVVVEGADAPPARIELHSEWPPRIEPLATRRTVLRDPAFEPLEDDLSRAQVEPLSLEARAAGRVAELACVEGEWLLGVAPDDGLAAGAAQTHDPRMAFEWVEPSADDLEGWRLTFVQTARALTRGSLPLGRERVALVGRWVRRTVLVEGRHALRVEPPMVRLGRTLELVASKRFLDQGTRRVRRARGGQTEFESMREYVPGDEPRRIDWKAFARRGRPMVRQYEPERGQEVVVLLDMGRRMGVAVETDPVMTKADRALDAALVFAAAVIAQRDRVGILAYDSEVVQWVAPRVSRRQFQRIKDVTADLQPRGAESNLAGAFRALRSLHRRRALVVVLTDLPDAGALDAEAAALRLAAGHRVVYAALNDPALAAAAEHADDDLERHAAKWLLEERATHLATLADHATTLDLPAANGVGDLLRAWFTERRRL